MNSASTTEIDAIAIFGGSGATGKALISHALDKGLRVRTLARVARSINAVPGRVEVLEGSLSSADDVLSTLDGCGAAICVFGPRAPYVDVFCEAATANIVTSMQKLGIQRLVCQTGAMIGAYPANRTLPFQLMASLFKRRSPQVAGDREGQENVVRGSGLAWTIVKPPRLSDGPATGKWCAGPDIRVGLSSSIARADLAEFLVAEAMLAQHLGQTIFIRS